MFHISNDAPKFCSKTYSRKTRLDRCILKITTSLKLNLKFYFGFYYIDYILSHKIRSKLKKLKKK